MRNILTHYGQVSLENTRTHATTYINSPTRDAQDNDMFYYFLVDLLTNEFHTTVLLYTNMYTITNIPVASSLLKQIIILTRVDNPASTMHIREMLIQSANCCFSRVTSQSSTSGSGNKWADSTHGSRRQQTYSTISGRLTKLPRTMNLWCTSRISRVSAMTEG